MFDIELCPLPFSMEEMFGFISLGEKNCALCWIMCQFLEEPETNYFSETEKDPNYFHSQIPAANCSLVIEGQERNSNVIRLVQALKYS